MGKILETMLDNLPAAIVTLPLAGFVIKGMVETYNTGNPVEGFSYTAIGVGSAYLASYVAEGVGSLIERRRINNVINKIDNSRRTR